MIVHLNTYAIPAVPVNVLVGLFAAVIFPPVPLIKVHVPVPITGALAANVVTVIPHMDNPV